MNSPKISVNADLVLQTLSKFDSPQKLKTIATATGSDEIKQLEKYQVRSAIEDHLLPAELVESFKREENGNEVGYYALTEVGQARACSKDQRFDELVERVNELRKDVELARDWSVETESRLNDLEDD